jgi:hypothetical protein
MVFHTTTISMMGWRATFLKKRRGMHAQCFEGVGRWGVLIFWQFEVVPAIHITIISPSKSNETTQRTQNKSSNRKPWSQELLYLGDPTIINETTQQTQNKSRTVEPWQP